MDCRTARLLVPFARPGAEELERADRMALEQHLAECPECRLEVEVERTLDGVFAHAMRAVPIPVGLRERVQIKLGRQRRRFYGRCAIQSLAAAAVLLIACLLTYRAFPEKFDSLVDLRSDREPPTPIIEPRQENFGPFRSKQHMLDHIRNQGYPAGLPRDVEDNWDFRWLQYAAVEVYDGRPTPTLAFKKGSATAKLRLLRWGQRDPDKLDALRAAGHTIIGHPQKDEFIAIVELGDGARLEDFLHPKLSVS